MTESRSMSERHLIHPVGVALLSVTLLAGPPLASAHLQGERPPAHDRDTAEIADDELERFARALNDITKALRRDTASRGSSEVRTVGEERMERILKRHKLTPGAFDRIRQATRHDPELTERLKALRDALTQER